jgi:hypothetical protein
MIQRVAFAALGMVLVLLGSKPALGQASKAPEWTHGLDFSVRRADEKEFSEKTRKVGGEAYLDSARNALYYITEIGAISVVPAGGFTGPKEIKAPKWLGAMNLAVRVAGENEFTDKTKKIGVEIFRDENDGVLLYITETGSIAAVRAGTPASVGRPKHLYGYELRVRKGPEGDFTDKTQKFGVEVVKDEGSNVLLYISDTGALAAIPTGANPINGDAKKPDWLFGLGLPVRKADEKDFSTSTRKWGVEVFKDDRAGNLIYIAETGSLGVVSASGFTRPEDKTKAPVRLAGQSVAVRKAGEKEFKTARKWGVEIYRDENSGNLVYATEVGSIGVLPPK